MMTTDRYSRMQMNVLEMPIEIQEKILKNVDGRTLVATNKVCRVWQDISKRIMWRQSLNNIPDEVLAEMLGHKLNEKDLSSYPWDVLFTRWLRSKANDTPPLSSACITHEDTFVCYKVSGDFVIVTFEHGAVVMYDNAGKVYRELTNVGSVVWDIAVMDVHNKGSYETPHCENETSLRLEHDFMLIVGDRFVQLYHLPIHKKQPNCKLVWSLNDLNNMNIAKSSVFGSLFAIAERPTILTVRQVSLSPDKQSLTVKDLSQVICHTWLWKWKIWKDKIICILATGEIAVWNLHADLWLSVSQRFSELLYQNPCFIYRGVIFCSSRTSQSLLEYWHCYPGDSYWLVCWDGEVFHKYYPKLLLGDDVTAICMKRRLVAVGTATGKLYLYDHKGPDREISNIWESSPITVFQVADKPIRSCDIGFDGTALTVVVRLTKKSLVMIQWPVEDLLAVELDSDSNEEQLPK